MKIDARGAQCPGPLMELIAAIKLIEIGEEVELLSADKGTADDVPTWCEKVGHELVSKDRMEIDTWRGQPYWNIVVRKLK